MGKGGKGKGKDGKGKGKGKAAAGGGGFGNGKTNSKPSAWQCRKCPNFWNGKDAEFCGKCGGKKSDCIKRDKPDTNLQAVLESNNKLRKEMEELKKSFDKKQPPARAHQAHARKGWGEGGGGNGSAQSSVPPQQSASAVDIDPSQKVIPPSEVLVSFCDQQVSLSQLVSMLEASKPCMPETHPRIVELRSAIEQAHKLRSDNTDPYVLGSQTERNIASRKSAIDKAQGELADLRAKRCEIDTAIANKEAKIRYESNLLEIFVARLEEAKKRQALAETPVGAMPSSLDKAAGQPLLRKWIRALYPDAYTVYEARRWEIPIVRAQADLYTQWVGAVGVLNGFASYASTRSVDHIDPCESTEAKRCLEFIMRHPEACPLAQGQARRAIECHAEGVQPIVAIFSAECQVLQEWCQPSKVGFAPVSASKERPLSAPYWLGKPDDPLRRIELKGAFEDAHWSRARAIIKATHGNVSPADMPSPMDETSYLQAAQQYCTAVVENEADAAEIPRYSEYLAHVKSGVKRAGDSVEDLEAAAAKK